MAGFFDFIKNPSSNTSQSSEPVGIGTQNGVQSTSGVASVGYSGIGPTPGGGTPYSGIGTPPGGGTPYSGIGNPSVVKSEPSASPTVVQDPKSVANPNEANPKQTTEPLKEPKDQKTDDPASHFSERSKTVVVLAENKAKEFGSDHIENEHFLYGLLSDGELSTFLVELKLDVQATLVELAKLYKKGTSKSDPGPSDKLKKILQSSLSVSEKYHGEKVEPEHMLLALLEDGESPAVQLLVKGGLKKEEYEKKLSEKQITKDESQKSPEQKKREELDLMTHLTQRSNRVFLSAQTKAKELKSEFIDSEHILHGLLSDSEIYSFFTEMKILPQTIEEELSKIYTTSPKATTPTGNPKLSPRIKRVLDNSLVIARKLGFEFISPEHILLALYEEGEGAGAHVLAKLGLKKEDLNKKITGKKEGITGDAKQTERSRSVLEQYTIDLTAKAAQGQLDPVVERSEVIERVIHILSRRTKNNPALVGEAGVGKTAIVEGLAEKIVSKEVPEPLLNKKLLQLDLMSILAGASHRGEFEERMKHLIEEVQASQGQIILFIDEIHNIVGAGASGEGSMDASNFLKPALARGEIQLIGATTLTEYRKYVEKDPALERRFQPVLVPEPTEEQAIKMLQATKDKYEAFHRVAIPQDVIEAAVKFSKRYVGDRFLPDKAVDLVDEAASAVRLPLISLPEEIKSLQTRIAELTQELTETEKTGDKVKARILRSKIDTIQSELKEKNDQYNLKKGQTMTRVTVEIIKDIVSRWTGIPVSKITGSEVERLAKLEDIMHERLIDQEGAVEVVAQAVRRGRAGLKSTQRPIGSFVFLGPTGVGKTELAKTLADVLFGQEEAMIRFDMTEYMEKHEVAKLLGAPPGYVGYEEGGKLTEAVRRKPYSVVLFDEVEKAHPDIFNILLQILDDGRLTDNKGHVISFKNSVVICTSNIGTAVIQDEMLRSGKTEVEEPPVLSTYVFSPRGREVLSIGAKYFQRIANGEIVNAVSDQSQDEKKQLTTFAFSPRGRQIITSGSQYFERDVVLSLKEESPDTDKKNAQPKAKLNWKKGILADYFTGQKIEEDQNEGKKTDENISFPVEKFDTHAISPQGVEMVTKDSAVFYRTSTTAKIWKTTNLIDYTKDNVVVNALPDAPEQQLPTAHWQTHAFSQDEMEIVTLDNRFWRRKENTNDWETGLLKDYFVNQTVKTGNFPGDYWDVHTFSPSGEEIIVVGNTLFVRKTNESAWESKPIVDYFGKEYPLEEKIEKKKVAGKQQVKETDSKEAQKWEEGMLLDYFAGQEIEKEEEKSSTSEDNKDKENVDFPVQGFDTHAISPKGLETITKGSMVFYRPSTTSKTWKTTTLIKMFENQKVVNAFSDAQDEQLPTVKLKTHAYTKEGNEIVSYKDRYWTRKQDTTDWETGYLKDYFVDQTIVQTDTKEEKTFPTTHWDVQSISPLGLEIIIVGENIWYRNTSEKTWKTDSLKKYFGEDFPLEKVIEEKRKVDEEIDRKKYGLVKDKVMNELRKFFRPELINRFDEVIVFEPLRFIHMIAIVKLQLKSVGKSLEDQDMGFMYTDAAVKEVVRSGFDPIYGARPLRRAIQKLIENPISTLIIETKVKAGDQILVDFDGENFVFNVEKVELVDASKLQKQVIKSFLCEVCANKFKTEVVNNATPVCSKCASKKLQEVIEEKEEKPKEEKSTEGKEEKPKEKEQVEEKTEPAEKEITPPPVQKEALEKKEEAKPNDTELSKKNLPADGVKLTNGAGIPPAPEAHGNDVSPHAATN